MIEKPLDPERCKKPIREPGRWPRYNQCSRKVWEDGYCKQHHPKTIAARDVKRRERWDAESKARRAKWMLERAAPKMRDLLRELVEECAKFQHDHPIPDIARRAAEILAELDEK